MSVAATRSAVLLAVDGHAIEVEAHVSDGLVGMQITGLADTSVGEAKDRVRAAVLNTGCLWPNKRVTVGLSPAALPKHGSGLDLAIAVSVLVADGQVPGPLDAETMWFGELALDGRVRPVRGVLIAALTALRSGCRRLVVSRADVSVADLVQGLEVIGVDSLAEALNLLGGEVAEPELFSAPEPLPLDEEPRLLDFAQVRGQEPAKYALQVAAAGGHHCAMLGSPGFGKTMLAERLPTILPPLSDSAAVEVLAISSAMSGARPRELPKVPPFAAPHHTASYVSVIGGGQALPVIGMVTAAHRGVLFLDEAPEFAVNVLDALRQPLESGRVVISRRTFNLELPARFQLIVAANPCPCGHAMDKNPRCSCTPATRRRYLGRISGPLLDRIDIRLKVGQPSVADLDFGAPAGRSSAELREEVCEARARAAVRLRDTKWNTNAEVPGPAMRELFPLPPAAGHELHRLLRAVPGSARGVDRIARLAWTVCDLRGGETPTPEDVARAVELRNVSGEWPA